ncbi:hypothetical protein D1R32_gp365 [Tunisvirus fontaine2]|uniref:Bacteriophage T5 Orf172 DNA-binding domain-containing protein n=1 Tax=Tunisvirus fontaine2 TaxID=1421067 RepID=V9SH33_9VIRU|nr:hypothetical protein D1R32_gp365 [Tunisvirus fontaine2]AHC55082.1 hypothetical protein TNS_ORF364 [Tunisvirus fontaine2]
MNKNGHVYIVSNKLYPENVFKLGMSKNIEQRLRSYGKDRKVHRLTEVPDCVSTEKKLLSVFSESFELFRGKETFKGNLDKMLKIFDRVCSPPKKERQWKKYLPNDRHTWMGKNTDEIPTLENYTRRRIAHVDLRDFPFHLEQHIKGNEKVVVIADTCDNLKIHRIGDLCFLKSDTLGMVARSVNPALGIIIDLGYIDVHFVVLEKNLPGDWILCIAEIWEQSIVFRSKRIPADKGDFLTPSLGGGGFWRDVECFGSDTGMDEELREKMENAHLGHHPKTLSSVRRYLVNDLFECYSIWSFTDSFSMELFTRNRSKKEFVCLPREPLSSIKRALCVREILSWISRTSSPSKRFSYGMKLFGVDIEILPETDEQLSSYTKWERYFSEDEDSDFEDGKIPNFIISECVYACFSWREELDWKTDRKEVIVFPVTFCDEPNPWSLEKTKKASDIHDINHKFPGYTWSESCETVILIDIIIHCKDGPIYIILFDSRKDGAGTKKYRLPPVKNIAKAVYFVDVAKMSFEYLSSVFQAKP